MSLIDSTYFRNSIKLSIGEYSDIQQYIDEHEKKVLIDILGYVNYTEMMEAVAAVSPAIEADPEADPPVEAVPAVVLPAKWDRLINGHTYEYSGRTLHWNGLINSDKISFIAYYVFCKYVESKQTEMAQAGATQPKNENSTVVDGVAKHAKAWNDFVKLYGYYGQDTFYPSCLNFLSANEADYSELFPELYGFSNQFGI